MSDDASRVAVWPIAISVGATVALASTTFLTTVAQDTGIHLQIGPWSFVILVASLLLYSAYAIICFVTYFIGMKLLRLLPLSYLAIFLLTLLTLTQYAKPYAVESFALWRLEKYGAPAIAGWTSERLPNGDRITWTGWGYTTGFSILNGPQNTLIRYEGEPAPVHEKIQNIRSSGYFRLNEWNADTLHLGPINDHYFIHHVYCCH